MNYKGTTKLETERLILRRFTIDDANDVFKNYASSDEVTRYITWETHSSISVTKDYLRGLIESYKDGKTFNWAIELKNENQVIGQIGATNPDENVSKIEVGYCIGEKWWGRGIATEALQKVISFLFEEVGVNRIEAYHNAKNLASGKVMQKCGMRLEGILRQSYKYKDGISDECIYGILRDDIKNNTSC